MRTTRKELADLTARLAEATGASGWSLDHNSAYGGWVIAKTEKSGGESRPFGDLRRSASAMADVLRFALTAIGMTVG